MHVLEPELRIISFTASLIPCCCSAARLSYDHMDRDGWATALDWSKHSNGEVIFSRRPESKDGSGGLHGTMALGIGRVCEDWREATELIQGASGCT